MANARELLSAHERRSGVMRGSSATFAKLVLFGLVSGFVLVGGGRAVSACDCGGFTCWRFRRHQEIRTPRPIQSGSCSRLKRCTRERRSPGNQWSLPARVPAAGWRSRDPGHSWCSPVMRATASPVVLPNGRCTLTSAAGRGRCPRVRFRPGSAKDARRHPSRHPARPIRPRG